MILLDFKIKINIIFKHRPSRKSRSVYEMFFLNAFHITERLLREGPCLKIIFILILKSNKVNDLNLKQSTFYIMLSLRTIKRRHTFYDTSRMFTVRLNFDDPNYIQTLSCVFHFVLYHKQKFFIYLICQVIYIYIYIQYIYI